MLYSYASLPSHPFLPAIYCTGFIALSLNTYLYFLSQSSELQGPSLLVQLKKLPPAATVSKKLLDA